MSDNKNNYALILESISKSYPSIDDSPIEVLKNLNLFLERNEIISLIAPSGSGKSTLLHIAGLLDSADSGIAVVGNKLFDFQKKTRNDKTKTLIRRKEIGFVYQFHHLLPEFTAEENIMIPQLANGTSEKEARSYAEFLLTKVGLSKRKYHKPAQLSGGEQQRVAICRALANRPSVLLADEPTGNLDPETSMVVFDLLIEMVRNEGLSAIIATHNEELAFKMDRVMRLKKGVLIPVEK